MIIVEGIEKAIVGWAKVKGQRVAVYSVDRISILIDKDLDDEATPEGVGDIIRFLEESVVDRAADERLAPPIFVHAADWDDLEDRMEEEDEDS